MTNNSQFLQDKLVLNYYNNKNSGYFVDVGANDGIKFSNTINLEKLGWNGICIDGNLDIFDKLKKNRNCICDCSVIYNNNSIVNFNILSNDLLCYIDNDIDNDNDNNLLSADINDNNTYFCNEPIKSIKLIKKEKYNTTTLTNILNKYNAPSFIEYLSLDTNGTEYDVLLGLNMEKYIFGYINVNVTNIDLKDKIFNLLKLNEYLFVGITGLDYNFIHKSLFSKFFINKEIYINIDDNKIISNFYPLLSIELKQNIDKGIFIEINGDKGLVKYDKVLFNKITWANVYNDEIKLLSTNYLYYHTNFICLIYIPFISFIDNTFSISNNLLNIFKENGYTVYYITFFDDDNIDLDIYTKCSYGFNCILFPYSYNEKYDVVNYFFDQNINGIIKFTCLDNDIVINNGKININIENLINNEEINDWDDFFYYMSSNTMYNIRKSSNIKFTNESNYCSVSLEAGFGNILFDSINAKLDEIKYLNKENYKNNNCIMIV